MLTLAQIAQALGGRISGSQVVAPGPGHSPADSSLTVKPSSTAEDGFVVYSHAGDEFGECRDYVRAKLGLPPWQPKRTSNGHADLRLVDTMNDAAISETSDMVTAPAPDQDLLPKHLVATYPYVSGDGEVLYEVLRYDPKSFRQRRPIPDGYAYTLGDVQPVLYRLPELLAFPDATIFVVEGEKDTDRLHAIGLTATTISGSTTWTPAVAEPLRGRHVFVLADNDKSGIAKAEKAAEVLHAIAASVRLVLLPGLPPRGDVSDYLDAGNTKEQLQDACLRAPLFYPKATTPPPVMEPLPFVDISSWRVGDGVPPREWGVLDLFPRRNVALLSGEGAVGKTLLLLQLGVAHAIGRDWLGTLPEPGPFLYFGAEDDTDEIHRRLADILNHYGADFPDVDDKLHLLTFAGEDAVLGHADRAGLVKPTPLFERLMTAATAIKPVLIGIDTSADVFAGNENDRSQVRQFVAMLRKMTIQANAYAIVNSHPSLTGINTGSGLSGSTGWHNSVRARAYLTTVKTDKDDEPDPTLRRLEFKKNNYGPVARSIDLRWKNGVYVPVGGIGSVDKMVKEQTADSLFMALLNRFNHQGRNVSEKAASKNYSPTAFAKEAEAKKYGLRKPDFDAAMRRLFAASQIAVEPYGPPCRGTTRLVTR
ncbi:AAA family ATPase [Bradyrhizobium sp. AUGA SZCCT0042]|uniref:AAA family ATPase n=1 Tax=Bradyrhizobium sp. AUGA SZCCT0042 TaxID=2807651 RepID=UPI001BA85C15|nr:AAA family ATPase [Bradyrhizobium sp. AUGA SZCCT0042]MBR1301239.1 AAA family ATPase [Bradyrhizobium sp. AUGA SZCCT0042]